MTGAEKLQVPVNSLSLEDKVKTQPLTGTWFETSPVVEKVQVPVNVTTLDDLKLQHQPLV